MSGNAFIAIRPHDLFDQVSLPDDAGFNIGASCRALYHQLTAFHLAGEAQPFENPAGLLQGYFLPNHLADSCFGESVDSICIRHRILIQHALHNLTAAPFPHAFQAETKRGFSQSGMHIAAEAVGSLAADSGSAESFPQVDKVPVRRLNQHVAGFGVHAGLATAHHTRDGKRSDGVGHQLRLAVKLRFRSIQQSDFLAGVGCARDDGWFTASPPLQQVVVKSMQRLPDFEHGVISRIHKGVDRAHSCQRKPALHPVGALAGLCPFHHSQHKARV